MGICCVVQETQTGALYQAREVDWEGDGREVQKGEDICIPMTDSWHLVPSLHGKIDGETVETMSDFILGAPKSLQMVTAAMKLKDTCSLEEKL